MNMSDCGVCINTGDYFDGPAEVWDRREVKARKPHTCCECAKTISPGQVYERYSVLFEGLWRHHNTCLVCAEIGEAFCCDGRLFGQLWNGFNDADIWRHLNTSCFDKLQSVEAKTELRRRWMKWKGLPSICE
jgi:hypothetical protein